MKGEDKINNLREELMDKIDSIKTDVNAIKVDIAKLPELLIERFDERYASKKYEKALDRAMWIILTTIIGALLALVIKI